MLIMLDRDGVINYDSADYIKSPAEWRALPGSLAAIARLNAAGHTVVVVTNQSGVGRGLYDEVMLTKIHAKMQQELQAVGGHVDKIYYCPHKPDDHCSCRKPKPGLLHQVQHDFPELFCDSILVGDAWRDIEAAQAVGKPAVLVKTGKGTHVAQKALSRGLAVYTDLADFVEQFLLENV